MKDKLLSEDNLNLRLPLWLKERLRKKAERELSTMSQVARKILVKEFGDEGNSIIDEHQATAFRKFIRERIGREWSDDES